MMKVICYRVKENENLTSICTMFHVLQNDVITLNNKSNFDCGEVILIPIKNKAVFLPTDDIVTIAKKLYTSIEQIHDKFGDKFFIGEKFEL